MIKSKKNITIYNLIMQCHFLIELIIMAQGQQKHATVNATIKDTLEFNRTEVS